MKSHQSTPTAKAIAYNNRGNAFIIKGDYEHAVQDFNEAIKLNPTFTKPFNNLGVAHLRKGEYDLAIQSLDKAIKLDPGYGGTFYANRPKTT